MRKNIRDMVDEKMIIIKNQIINGLKDECGMGVIEVTLIVVVLVGLAVLFNSELNGIAEIVFKKLKGKVESI